MSAVGTAWFFMDWIMNLGGRNLRCNWVAFQWYAILYDLLHILEAQLEIMVIVMIMEIVKTMVFRIIYVGLILQTKMFPLHLQNVTVI